MLGSSAILQPIPSYGAAVSDDMFPGIIDSIRSGVVTIEVVRNRPGSNAVSTNRTGEVFYDDPDIDKFFGGAAPSIPPAHENSGPGYAQGSGFIIGSDGIIMTNAHVIQGSDTITVTLYNRHRSDARVIGSDRRSDIALIKLSDLPQNVPVLPLGTSEGLRAGQWVLAFGSPFPHIQTVTAGIISATGRNSLGISDYEDYIQTDAAINPGNSGGPLVNSDGEVIGVNSAFVTETGGYMGVGFAIPIDMARRVAAQLIENGTMTRGWLGVGLKDSTPEQIGNTILDKDSLPATVIGVKPGSPALAAGIREGDLIISVDGHVVRGAADLRNRVSLTAPNTVIKLVISRKNSTITKKVRLGVLE
ncbi:S1C family serine protease [Desulforhopalus singaporensis]|uniref:S1C family serine protease n=1 Tax=Desulforhopalus singaporensis TaxID=91360 RepID=UPI0015A3730A|nr:trypsin-like peptidase domain-containing protein [Desulforhopalus singaporensis]